MRKDFSRFMIMPMFLFALSIGQGQTLIPQIADGGGWQTTLVLTNTSATSATASLSFFQDLGSGATQAWNPPFLEVSSTQNLTLPAGGTLFLHTSGTAGATTAGWAQMTAGSSVAAYAIFTERVAGRQDQDATAAAAASATRVLVPFDNTNGFLTSIAIANPTAASESISVGIQPASGAVSFPAAITLPAQGHTAFTMPQQFSTSSGQTGLLELAPVSGSISVVALRFNPSNAFTAIPVYPETGPPLIVTTGSGGGTLPMFNQIIIHATGVPDTALPGAPVVPELGITQILVSLPLANGTYAVGTIQGSGYGTAAPSIVQYSASWSSVTVSGQTLTFNGLQASASPVEDNTGAIADFTLGTLTVTLSPQGTTSSGTVTGTMNMVSPLAVFNGAFTGTYTAQ